jgi:uncharacterized protein
LKFTRESTGSIFVRSVRADGIVVGDEIYVDTIALTTERVLENWPATDIANLDVNDFGDLLAAEPEIVLLGTGSRQLFPPRELMFAMARRGVGFEVMDTRAAARTFNVLVSEDRDVAAVLYR